MSTSPPTVPNMLSMNVGGVNVNYDLGPSTATVASQAYSFVNSSMAADTNLLQGSISGSQDFLSSLSSPIIDMAQSQQQFNETQLPNMFYNLESNNFSLGQEAIGAQVQTANASIAASQAEAKNAGGGGGCYITTAVCDSLGLPDDCAILETLRTFRDSFMRTFAVGRAELDDYYLEAPLLVEAILACDDARTLLRRLLHCYILPAVRSINAGDQYGAYVLYRAMVMEVRDTFRPLREG